MTAEVIEILDVCGILLCHASECLERDETKNTPPHQNVFPSEGLYSRQHLTAIELSTVYIYLCPSKKNHLYKSLSLPLSQKMEFFKTFFFILSSFILVKEKVQFAGLILV